MTHHPYIWFGWFGLYVLLLWVESNVTESWFVLEFFAESLIVKITNFYIEDQDKTELKWNVNLDVSGGYNPDPVSQTWFLLPHIEHSL